MGSDLSAAVILGVGPVCELLLRVRALPGLVWELPGLPVFEDEQEAFAELARQRERDRRLVADTLSRLLRLDTELVGARQTPSRIETLQQMVAAGLVPEPVVSPVLAAQCVTDAVWETIRPLAPLLAPTEILVLRWLITLEGDEAGSVELPEGVLGSAGDVFAEDPFPAERLLRAIVALQGSGWRLVHAWLSRSLEEAVPDTDVVIPDPLAAELRFRRRPEWAEESARRRPDCTGAEDHGGVPS